MSSGAIGALMQTRERYKDRNLPCADVSQATMFRIRNAPLRPARRRCSPRGALGAAAGARLARRRSTFFEGSTDLLNPTTRPHALAQLQALGVKALRVELYWYDVAPSPTSATRPNFDATNPASYDWGQYDALLAEAQRLHWQVLLTVTSPVPRWATSNHKAPYVTRPDDLDFQEFMTAVARHYGSEVSLYSIWNEPNHPAFLLPQWNSNGTPASPRIYRGLYQAGYAGLQAAGIAAPEGAVRRDGADRLRHRQRPARRLEGAAARRRAARVPARSAVPERALPEIRLLRRAAGDRLRPPRLHARRRAPIYVPPERDDVTIGVLSRLTRALDLAARAHAIPAHLPIYLTEFGVQSKPNRYLGVPVAQQAEYDAIAEHIAWSNPRVAAFSQYLLKDDPLGGAPGSSVHGGTIGFQTGPGVRERQRASRSTSACRCRSSCPSAGTASRCGVSCGRRPARRR